MLRDDWTGKRPLPLDISDIDKAPAHYLRNLELKLEVTSEYAAEHAARERARYTHHYKLRSRDVSFIVGERGTLFSAVIDAQTRSKNSPVSYLIEVNGKQQWCNVNHSRKYNECVSEATVHNCAINIATDQDFGYVPTLDIQPENLNQIAMNLYTYGGSLNYDG